MPLLQYFGWVGSLLLAVMLAANAYLPAPAVPQPEIPLDRKISIRIHTDHKWPERVVFDTSGTMVTQKAGTGRDEAAAAAMSAAHVRPCFRPPCSAVLPRNAGMRDFLRFARGQG